MLEIPPAQVTPRIRALFRQDQPPAWRCFAVLAAARKLGCRVEKAYRCQMWSKTG